MSTKTNFKRVALVAVAALGLGVLTSVAPASAAATATDDGKLTQETATASGTVGTVGAKVTSVGAQTWSITTAGSVGVTLGKATGAHANLTGPCVFGTVADTATSTVFNSSLTKVTEETTDTTVAVKSTGTVGVCVVRSYAAASEAAGPTDQLTISVVAAATVGAFSASESFARIGAAASAAVETNADTALAYKVNNGSQGILAFSINDGNGVAMSTSTIVTASATNGAVVAFSSGAQVGISASKAYSGTHENVYVAQGTANAAISTAVTISVNGVPWITKSFTLIGDIAKIVVEAGTNGAYGKASSTGNTNGQIAVSVLDAAGVLIGSKSPSFAASSYTSSVSSYEAVTSSATVPFDSAFTCTSIKGTAPVTMTIVNAAAAKITSNTFTVNCTGAAYSYSASLDKASYTRGEIATLTITAKDSAGNLAEQTSTLGAGAAISGSYLTAVTAPVTTDAFAAGVVKYKFIVGDGDGSYNMVVDLPAIDDAVTVAYKITSNSSGVSNADVLKAIVSLIASINKQIAALQKALLKK
jgi:hypothetical protein